MSFGYASKEKKKDEHGLIHEAADDGMTFAQRKAVKSMSGPADLVEVKESKNADSVAIDQKTLLALDAELRERTYEKKGIVKWKRNPSSEMKAILDAIDDYKRFTANIIDAGSFDADLKQMSEIYLYIISSCETYTSTHTPKSKEGQLRLEYVNRIKELVTEESKKLEDVAGYYKDSLRTDGITWMTVVSSARTRSYVDGKNGVTVKMGGGAMSTVYILSGGEKKLFFKESEPIPEAGFDGVMSMLNESYRKKSDEYPADTDEHSLFSTRMGDLTAIWQCISPEDYEGITIKVSGLLMSDIPDLITKIKAGGDEAETAKDALQKELQNTLGGYANLAAFINRNPGRILDISEVLIDMARMMTLSESVKEAGIERPTRESSRQAQKDQSKTLSVRNVVSSRLAEALGIGDLIAKSTLATVEVQGKKMTGVAMEEAQGKNIDQVVAEAEKNGGAVTVKYTGKALRQLANLQMFDILCGQIDRHSGNYFGQIEQVGSRLEVTGITGIDNDLAFGLISYAKINEANERIGEMKKVERVDPKTQRKVVAIPHIDRGFAENLLMMTPEQIDILTCDLISEKEREFLCDRLRGLQELIRIGISEEEESGGERKIFLSDDSEWDAYEKLLEEKGVGSPEVSLATRYGYLNNSLYKRSE